MGAHAARALLMFVLLACLPWLGSGAAAEPKRVALVIGNSAYSHAATLKNPRNDAIAMATALESLGFTVIKGVDLNRDALEEIIRRFAREMVGAESSLLFYAGHGLQVDGRNYIAPIDTRLSDEADLEFETIDLDTILKRMEQRSKTRIVLLDACRDNPLARSLAQSMGTRSTTVGRGLARIEAGIGTMIAFATEPGNVALDGAGENSPFAAALLKHIGTPGLDIDGLMRLVRQDVITATNRMQVPWSHSSLVESFYFKTKPEEQTAAPVTPPAPQPQQPAVNPQPQPEPLDPATKAYAETKIVGTCDAYEHFKKSFPGHFLTGLADAWIKEHCKEQDQQKLMAYAQESCTKRLGVNAGIRPDGQGGYACECKSGYELDFSRAVCVAKAPAKPRSVLMSEAESSCKARYGQQAKLDFYGTNGEYRCGCTAPYRFDLTGTACTKPSDAELRVYYTGLCQQRYGAGSILNRYDASGQYWCDCSAGHIWNASNTQCLKPTAAELKSYNDSLCKKKYGEPSYSYKDEKGLDRCNCGKGRTYDQASDSCKIYTAEQQRADAIASCRREYGSRYIKTTFDKKGRPLCHFMYTRAQAMAMAQDWCRKQLGRKASRIDLKPEKTQWRWTCH